MAEFINSLAPASSEGVVSTPSTDPENSIVVGSDGLHWSPNEVVENVGVLSGTAPVGAQWGINTLTGQSYYVDSGIWTESLDKQHIATVTSVGVGDYTVLPTDEFIYKTDVTAGGDTITLPITAGTGQEFLIKDYAGHASHDNITIVVAGGALIEGRPTAVLSQNYQSKTFDFDGTNYVIRGAFTPKVDSEIVVHTAADLVGPLRSDVVYVIDGVIDMGTTEIEVPPAGLVLRGLDYFISGLTSTENNHTMFKNEAGNYAGNVKLGNLFITSSGLLSQVFDLDNQENFGSVEFNSVNLGDFSDSTTSLGELTNYRQFRGSDMGFFRNEGGLSFSGTWAGGFRIVDTIVLLQAAGSTLFQEGAGLTFAGRCISDINTTSVDPTSIVFDFQSSNFLNDGAFQLTNAVFPVNSAISVTLDGGDLKAYFKDCLEIENTRPGYEIEWTTSTPTPLTVNTPTLVLGTTVISDNTWFSQTANNSITYGSTVTKDYKITLSCLVGGGANDDITLSVRQWDDSAGAYIILKEKTRSINNLQGGTDTSTYHIIARANSLGLNDRIEIWMENITNGNSATMVSGSDVLVEEI